MLRVPGRRLPHVNSCVPLRTTTNLRWYTPPPPPPPDAAAAVVSETESTDHGNINIAEIVGKCIPLPKPFHPHEVTQSPSLAQVNERQLITDGNGAASYVGYAMSETMFIYPITPSSVMAENADSWVVAGRHNVFGRVPTITEMQSEAGAAAAVHGALVAGGFACSFTSSQGLLLMLPNMFQIAGQLLPGVLHVASRSVSGSTTSICGDHSDVMAVRAAGFALLSSHTVQETHDMAVIAHVASLKTSIPFMHFFEGFELSHQVTNIQVLPYEEMARLIPHEAVIRHRERALSPHHPKRLNSSTGRDVVFQISEATNLYYQDCAAAVQQTMDEFAALTGRQHHLFRYYGSPDAELVVVVMGSGAKSVEFAVDQLQGTGAKVGVLSVHLYRPWGMAQFMAALPKTVRRVAVLDRVKECGSLAEPLFLDVAATLQQHNFNLDVICGGRYGVSEKGFNAAMAISVFENLQASNPKTRFTVGIVDDVTNLSLPLPAPVQVQAPETRQCIFWGMGGDGTVGANKQAIDIICSNTKDNAMAQFFYTPHKSGAITTSHVRFGSETFESQPITTATYVASHHPSYIYKFDMLKPLLHGGTFVLNTKMSKEEVLDKLPIHMKKQLGEKEASFYIIDAHKIAAAAGLGENINMIMQSVFFKLLGMFDDETSLQYLKDSIEKTFGKKKDRAVVDNNIRGVENALAHLIHVEFPMAEWAALASDSAAAHPELPVFVSGIQRKMLSQQGNTLPVSAFNPDGATPPTTAKFEKRAKAPFIVDWDPKDCNQCNLCAFVCPHSCLRPFLLTPKEVKAAPGGKMEVLKAKDGGKDMKYRLQVSPMDCTGCEVCVRVCPEDSLQMVPSLPEITKEGPRWEYLEQMDPKGDVVDKWTVRGSQMQRPLLEFSGACDGCAQTTYVKVMTQLFGNRMMIANATGCSSVWGSLFASNPYTTDKDGRGPAFARSLFEDAAEFGFGMIEATNRRRASLVQDVASVLQRPDVNVSPALRAALEGWLGKHEDANEADGYAKTILPLLDQEKDPEAALAPLVEERDVFIKPCHWVFGGDGWAHDIGFGGLDHILAQSQSSINVFVMDNEVYSNTGGQASKSTPIGAVAKMAAGGKRIHKKDLGMMAMLYGHVYVAQVSVSHPEHFLKVLKEAESYDGPSMVTAYCPCRDHTVDLGDMVDLCREAVDSGYFPLYRYDPRLSQPFIMDSDIRQDVLPFLKKQGRYRILLSKAPETAKELFADMQQEILRRNKMAKLWAHPAGQPTLSQIPVSSPTPAPSQPPPAAAPTPAVPEPAAPAAAPPTAPAAAPPAAPPAADTPPVLAAAPDGTGPLFRAKRHDVAGNRVGLNLVAEEPATKREFVGFMFNGKPVQGYEGEMISSAMIAGGEEIFGYHHKDGSPQGMFCANGQCSACQVVVDSVAVKACMHPVRAGMTVESGLPLAPEPTEDLDVLPADAIAPPRDVPVVIIGGGPAGLAAAYELARVGEQVLIVDDKDRLGGKLVLQTHKFFGTVEDTRAGTRGFEIAKQLGEELRAFSNVEVLLETTAVGVYSDKVIGLHREKDQQYDLVRPQHLLVAAGARERMMPFPGNTLPGVYGAGAFQTLVNRDWVRPAKKVLIIGGGNVGLIAGYHAVQAGMQVVGLLLRRTIDQLKGYKVHADKLMRLGVPILTQHNIVAAHGEKHVESATIVQVDADLNPIDGTERELECDCVLVAVGLSELNEFVKKAEAFGIPTYSAGDSQEVAEASAAMLTGKIAGIQIAEALGHEPEEDIDELKEKADLMRLPGGAVKEQDNELPERGVRPVLHCWQEIPCNACKPACQYSLIKMEDVISLPHFNTKSKIECSACGDCVAACPGLAVTVVDTRQDPENPLVMFPFEIDTMDVAVGKTVQVVGDKGEVLGEHPIVEMEHNTEYNTYLVTVQVPKKIALQAAAIWQQDAPAAPVHTTADKVDTSRAFACRCERVSIDDIQGVAETTGCADVNQIKAITRQGMGACGGKNCGPLSERILQQMGLGKEGVTSSVDRPLFVEIPLQELARTPTPPAPESTVPVLKHVRDKGTNAFDVVVLGAGSIGVPLAMALAHAGKKVACLDSGASPGQGDNKRAIGGIRQTFGQPSKITVMRRSLEMFRNWRQDMGEDIGWHQDGYIFPVYREQEEEMLKGLLDVQHQYGLNNRWISAQEMSKLVPGLNPDGLRGGTYSPEDGNAVPFLAINSMYRRAAHLGAAFHFHTDISSITRDVSGAVSGVVTHALGKDASRKPTQFYAPVVVNALGATTNAVLQTVGRELALDPDSHEAGVTEAVQRIFNGLIVDLRPRLGSKNFYFYQNEHGQLVFCITPDPAIPGYDCNETSQFLPQVSKRMCELMPRLGSVSVRRTWRGLYNNTADGLPLVGWDSQIPGLLHATGMGGHGFMLGPGTGEMLSRLVAGQLTDDDKMVLEAWNPWRDFQGDECLR